MTIKAVRGRVSGIVQGVGFRAFTERAGRELGVRGWVKNLPDGRVEFTAEGPTAVVDAFLERVKHGPRAARVDALEVESIEPTGRAGFEQHR